MKMKDPTLVKDIGRAREQRLITWVEDTVDLAEAAEMAPAETVAILLSCLARQFARIAVGVKLPKEKALKGIEEAWESVPKDEMEDLDCKIHTCSSVEEVEAVLKEKFGDELPDSVRRQLDRMRTKSGDKKATSSSDNVWGGPPATVH